MFQVALPVSSSGVSAAEAAGAKSAVDATVAAVTSARVEVRDIPIPFKGSERE